jgi:Tfp pilus assembly protein PilN
VLLKNPGNMLLNTTINLLSKQKRGRLEHLIKFIFIRDILEIVLLVYSVLAIILLWSWLVLQENFNNLAESSVLVNREYSKYNQEIRQVNGDIRNFNQAAKYYSPITPKLTEIINTLPEDIKLNSLELSRAQNKIVLSGTALTRDALLNYQKTLKQISWLENIETPTSQLFQKENINFEVKATGLPALSPTERPKKATQSEE